MKKTITFETGLITFMKWAFVAICIWALISCTVGSGQSGNLLKEKAYKDSIQRRDSAIRAEDSLYRADKVEQHLNRLVRLYTNDFKPTPTPGMWYNITVADESEYRLNRFTWQQSFRTYSDKLLRQMMDLLDKQEEHYTIKVYDDEGRNYWCIEWKDQLVEPLFY